MLFICVSVRNEEKRKNVQVGNDLSSKELGSFGSGLSSFGRDTDLLMMGVSGSLLGFSMAMMGGITASFDSDTLRS
jgi:hypothetical protein